MSALPTHGDVDSGQAQHHGLWRFRLTRFGGGLSEQGSTQGELASAPSIAQQSVVAQPGEAAREHVQEEASDELAGVEAHHLELVAAGVVAPSETHLLGVEVDEAMVEVVPGGAFSVTGSALLGRPSQGSSKLVEPYSPVARMHRTNPTGPVAVAPGDARRRHGVGTEPDRRRPRSTRPAELGRGAHRLPWPTQLLAAPLSTAKGNSDKAAEQTRTGARLHQSRGNGSRLKGIIGGGRSRDRGSREKPARRR